MLVPLTDPGNPYTALMVALIRDHKARASKAQSRSASERRRHHQHR